MGLIICDKHGESRFLPYISNELSDKVLNNVILKAEEIAYVDIRFIDEDDGQEMFSVRYWMSRDSFNSLAAKASYEIRSDEDEEKLDELFNPIMKGGGLCGRCFEAYLEKAKQK